MWGRRMKGFGVGGEGAFLESGKKWEWGERGV